MKRSGLASSGGNRRGERGGALLEFALVFPLLVLVMLGTVDASLLVYDMSAATKATYRGARVAVVTDPVAKAARFSPSAYTTALTKAGNYCSDSSGVLDTVSAKCPTVDITCWGADALPSPGATGYSGSCTSGAFDDKAFKLIFDAVQAMFPFKLSTAQVQVSYKTTGLGYVGQSSFDGNSGELPMNVTVSLRCIKHEFYFVGGLVGWVFPPLTNCSDVTLGPTKGVTMPSAYTTLPSEDLATNY